MNASTHSTQLQHRRRPQLDASKTFGKPIATQLVSGAKFLPAENYHQDYMFQYPHNPYIVINDLPKVENPHS